MSPARHFAQSYAEARDKFVSAAHACGARQFRHVHPSERGVDGEELSMDFAFVGKPGARNLLLLISGTHGVEGFCGSGCQVALLHDAAFLKAVELAKVEVLMLHALNPYGFSHLRRVNEDNADLNRNFVDFGTPLPVNSAYAEIHDAVAARIVAAAGRHGSQARRLGRGQWRQGLSGGRERRPIPVS